MRLKDESLRQNCIKLTPENLLVYSGLYDSLILIYSHLVCFTGGASALHRAALMGHLRIVQLLVVDYNANVMLQDSDGKTALHKVNQFTTLFRFYVITLLGQCEGAQGDSQAVDQAK